jgi:hypothetical protein
MLRSVITSSGLNLSKVAKPSSPFSAAATSWPALRNVRQSRLSRVLVSSMARIFIHLTPERARFDDAPVI